MSESLTRRRYRCRWDRYQTRCAKVSGGWHNHRVLRGWRKAARTDAAWFSRERLNEALYHTSCDYFRGVGPCSLGCWEEPRCHTREPVEGWHLWGQR